MANVAAGRTRPRSTAIKANRFSAFPHHPLARFHAIDPQREGLSGAAEPPHDPWASTTPWDPQRRHDDRTNATTNGWSRSARVGAGTVLPKDQGLLSSSAAPEL